MLHRLFTLLSALSLLLCVAVGVVWVRSYSRSDMVRCDSGHGLMGGVTFHRGALFVFYVHEDSRLPSTSWGVKTIAATDFAPLATRLREMGRERWTVVGAECVCDPLKSPGLAGNGYTLIITPAWMIAAGLAVGPLAHGALAVRGRSRLLKGQCSVCGYDLRATPGRCPECGTAAEGKAV